MDLKRFLRGNQLIRNKFKKKVYAKTSLTAHKINTPNAKFTKKLLVCRSIKITPTVRYWHSFYSLGVSFFFIVNFFKRIKPLLKCHAEKDICVKNTYAVSYVLLRIHSRILTNDQKRADGNEKQTPPLENIS